MAYFDRDNRGGGGKGFGGKKSFGRPSFGGDRGGFNKPRPFLHKAICSSCGAECEVPFKPTGDRPVYCNNCFKKGDNPTGGKFGGNFKERSFGDKPVFNKPVAPEMRNNDQFKSQLEQLNTKLDKILQALSPATAVKSEPSKEKKTEVKKPALGKVKAAPKKAKKKSK
jgi:CxxC-x17-CxxC domain-containing protein